jgi:hypothetical protein
VSDVHANYPALQALEAEAGYADFVSTPATVLGYYRSLIIVLVVRSHATLRDGIMINAWLMELHWFQQ